MVNLKTNGVTLNYILHYWWNTWCYEGNDEFIKSNVIDENKKISKP